MAITTNITNYSKAHDKGEGGGTTIIYGNNNTSGAGGDLSLSSITAGVGTIKKLSGNQINYNEGAITYFASGDGTITKLKGEELKYTKAKIGELISNSIDNSGSISTKDISADNAWLKELQSNKITTEYLTVTKQAHFFELIIDKVKSVGGTMIMTAANAVIDYSKAVDSNGDYLSSLTDPNAAYYDVFWLAQESNGRKVTNDWLQYDQAYCQSFNNVSQGVNYDVQNKYYWRLVTDVLADRYMNLNTGAELPLSQAAQATVNSVYINTPRILYVADNTETTIDTGWNGNAQTLDDIITGSTWTQTSGGSDVLQGTMTTTNTVFGIELKPVADSTLTQANGSKFILDCSSARLNIGIYYTDGTSEWFPAPDNATTHYEYVLKAEYDSTNNVYVSTNTSIIEAVVITNADEVAWKLVHGIRLSNTICDSTVVSNTSSIPTAGDNISQLGYRYNELQNPSDADIERASAIIISACQTPDKGEIGQQGPKGQQSTIRGITPPSYAQYERITDFHLSRYRGTFMDAKGSEFHGEFIATNGQTIEEMIEEMETSDYQLFIAYSNASDGSVDFTKKPVEGKTYSYMGYCSKPIPPGETYQSVEETLVVSDYKKWAMIPSSSGTPGGNWVYAYKVSNSATTAPEPPNVNNVPKAPSELPYNGWYITPQSATTSEYIWKTQSFISGTGNQQLWENAVRLTGIAGTDGTDGTDGSDGTSVTITGKIITYAVTTTSTQPADSEFIYYSIPQLDLGDYLWTRMVILFSDNNSIKSYSVSRIGTDGTDGDDGLDGKTTHWAYATSADGSQNFSTTLFAGATYVGTYDDYTRADSLNYRDYSWTKLKGENGQDGTSITITSREVVYQISSSGTTVPTGNWSSTVPAPQQGKYLWTRTTVTYSDNSTTVAYSVSYYGADGTGQDAEYYTYFPLVERAIVDSNGTLGLYLQYKIAHIVGTTVTYIDASDSGYHMRAKGNHNSTYLSFTANTTNHVSTYQNAYYMSNYQKQSSKPIYFNIYLTKGTSHTVVAQSVVAVIFDAAATLTITDNIQSTVSGYDKSIQQINTSINNIGIPNLVMNGAFKKGATYWTNWGTPATREITTDANGNKWMHIVSDPSSVTGSNKNWQGYSQNHYTDYDITVEAGQKYTVSLMAYARSGTPTICVGFHWFTPSNTAGSANSQIWNTWTINRTPTKYTWTLTIPSGIDHFNIMVGDNTTSVQNFYISFIKMEKGEVATDWTPSIEETDASITTLNTGYSQLTQNYNSINATVQGYQTTINDLTGDVESISDDVSELQMTATQIQSTVSSISNEFDNMNIGAENMVWDSAKITKGAEVVGYPYVFRRSSLTPSTSYGIYGLYGVYCSHSANAGSWDIMEARSVEVRPNTEYVMSFWAKGSGKIRSHMYYGNGISPCARAINDEGTKTTSGDGSIDHTLTSDWKRHWVKYTTSNSLPTDNKIRFIFARILNENTTSLYICGPKIEIGNTPTDWSPAPKDGENYTDSQITQTANSIEAKVNDVSVRIDSGQITLNGDTNVNGTLTLSEAGQGFILSGSSGKTQITPESIGTYNNFISNASPNVRVNNSITRQVASWSSSQSTTTASWSFSNSFGTVPSGVTIPLSGQSITFRNYNSGNILTPSRITNTYRAYINGSLISGGTFTNSSTSGSIGSFTTSSSGTLRVDVTSSVTFYTSSLANNTVIGSYNYYIKLPKTMFTMLGYDGFASNFGNNNSVYFGPQAAYLRYGNYGINISDAGIKKLVGSNWMPMNYLNVVRTSASPYNLGDSDKQQIEMVVTTSSRSQTIILPLPSSCPGRRIYIKCNGSESPKIYCNSTSTTTKYFVGPSSNSPDRAKYDDMASETRVFISDGTYWQAGYLG